MYCDFLPQNKWLSFRGNLCFLDSSIENMEEIKNFEMVVRELLITQPENIDGISLLLVPTYRASFPFIPYMETVSQNRMRDFSNYLQFSSNNDANTPTNDSLYFQTSIYEDSRAETFGMPPPLSEHVVPLQLTGEETLEELLTIPNVTLLSSTTAETAQLLLGNVCFAQGKPAIAVPLTYELNIVCAKFMFMQYIIHIQRKDPTIVSEVLCRSFFRSLDLYKYHTNEFTCDALPRSRIRRFVELALDSDATTSAFQENRSLTFPSPFTHTPVGNLLVKTNRPLDLNKTVLTDCRINMKLTLIDLRDYVKSFGMEKIFEELKESKEEGEDYYYGLSVARYTNIFMQRGDQTCIFFFSKECPFEFVWQESSSSSSSICSASLVYVLHDEIVSSATSHSVPVMYCLTTQTFLNLQVHNYFQDQLKKEEQDQDPLLLATEEEFRGFYYKKLLEIGSTMSYQDHHWQLPFASKEENQSKCITDYVDYQINKIVLLLNRSHSEEIAPFLSLPVNNIEYIDSRQMQMYRNFHCLLKRLTKDIFPNFTNFADLMSKFLGGPIPASVSIDMVTQRLLWDNSDVRPIRIVDNDNDNDHDNDNLDDMLNNIRRPRQNDNVRTPTTETGSVSVNKEKFLHLHQRKWMNGIYAVSKFFEVFNSRLDSVPKDTCCCIRQEPIKWGGFFYRCHQCTAVFDTEAMNIWLTRSGFTSATCPQCRAFITELPTVCWNIRCSFFKTPAVNYFVWKLYAGFLLVKCARQFPWNQYLDYLLQAVKDFSKLRLITNK